MNPLITRMHPCLFLTCYLGILLQFHYLGFLLIYSYILASFYSLDYLCIFQQVTYYYFDYVFFNSRLCILRFPLLLFQTGYVPLFVTDLSLRTVPWLFYFKLIIVIWWFDTFSIYLVEWYWIYINFIIFLVIGSIILIISSQLLPLLFLVHCYYSCYYFNWLQLSRLDHSSSIGTKREYGSSNWRVPIHTGSALGLDIYLDICLDMSDDGRQIVAILSAVILINCTYVYFISMCLYISCIYWL